MGAEPVGHLFALHGDLLRLAADGFVIPCDDRLNVSDWWSELLADEMTVPGDSSTWVRLPERSLDSQGCVQLGTTRTLTLVSTASVHVLEVPQLVERVIHAVAMTGRSVVAHSGRELPLVALPLPGTGAGGLQHSRRLVVEALVPELELAAARFNVDIALVLRDSRDQAAVQASRTDPGRTSLRADQVLDADELGGRAASGRLSLFLGAGLSVPLSLPSWEGLVDALTAGLRPGDLPIAAAGEGDLLARAQAARDALGDEQYFETLTSLIKTPKHAIGHALLAGLACTRMVTTNYDVAMELALSAVHGEDGFRVLTGHLADGSMPWLLKLHGDVVRPSTMVLTTSDYERLEQEGRALHGVVQSLLLTSHLLFVGFSLKDVDFLTLAEGVRSIRREALEQEEHFAGTALALHPGAVNSEPWRDQVRTLELADAGDDRAAARLLEIFLDRMAWKAASSTPLSAEYLLDERYAEGAPEADRSLAESLTKLLSEAGPDARGSAAWRHVDELLRRLGHPV